MPETLSTTMQNILAGRKRKADYTIDITFPDATFFKFATAPLTISGRGTYTNDLEAVGEIRRTIDASATDRVSIGIQNLDRVLGLHVAEHWQKWRRAEAVIGRYYRGGASYALTEWIERFRGAILKPNANDFQVTMDIIVDTVSPGQIVCNRSLAPTCPFKFKDPKTCAYVGSETLCNHNLKSSGGCDGRNNTHHFGGTEHRYNPDVNIPGTDGNPGDDPGHGPPCPRLDQYVRVRGENGERTTKMVCFFTEEDWLWNPVTQRFHETEAIEIFRNVPIWEIVTSNGAVGYSSFSHPVLWYKEHTTGEPVARFQIGDPVLCEEKKLVAARAVGSRPTGESGDVMRITMKDGKIYCYGNAEDKLIVCHNRKNDIPGLN
jgi:hypothetical protein